MLKAAAYGYVQEFLFWGRLLGLTHKTFDDLTLANFEDSYVPHKVEMEIYGMVQEPLNLTSEEKLSSRVKKLERNMLHLGKMLELRHGCTRKMPGVSEG